MRKTYLLLAIILFVIPAQAQLRSRELHFGDEYTSKTSSAGTSGEGKYVELNRLGVETGTRDNNYTAALSYFEQALKLNPECLVCRYNVGRSLIKLERYRDAIEEFEKITEKNQGYADAYASIGEAYSLAGRHVKSLRFYQKALAISPDDPITLNNYANSLDQVGEYENALSYFNKALKIYPDMVEALCSRGVALFKLGRKKEAYKSVKRAYELKPDDAETNNNLGVILDDLGKKKSAFKHYKEAVRLKPDFPNAVYNLGLMYIERGERKEAAEQLKALEKLSPELAKELKRVLWSKWVIDAGQVASN